MFCPNCGKPTKEGAKFCEHCGHSLEAVKKPAEKSESKKVQKESAANKPKSKISKGNWLAIAALVIVLAIAALYISLRPNKVSVDSAVQLTTLAIIRITDQAEISEILTAQSNQAPTEITSVTAQETVESPALSQTPNEQPSETPTAQPTDSGFSAGSSDQIAFASNRSGQPQIWLLNLSDSALTQLSDISAGACQPSWSPDGTQLVFTSPCKGNSYSYPESALYLLTLETAEVTQLSAGGLGDYDPSWSPDGSQIIFTSLREGNRSLLFIYDFATQTEKQFTSRTVFEFQADWSPDSSEIVFVSPALGPELLFLSDSSVSESNQFLRPETTDGKIISSPKWSADGEGIFYVMTPLSGGFSEIYYASFADNGLAHSQLISPSIPGRDPDQSSDGTQIAFESWAGSENHDIWSVQINGEAASRLSTDPANDFDPAWRP